MNIEIKKQIDAQRREVYQFTLIDLNAVFTYFHIELKLINKKKWLVDTYWDKYNVRNSTTHEPTLPDEIREEALNQLKGLVKVKTWFEYKGNN